MIHGSESMANTDVFLGIYSGRLKIKNEKNVEIKNEEDSQWKSIKIKCEEDSQLGIVWKEELIEKILASDDRK